MQFCEILLTQASWLIWNLKVLLLVDLCYIFLDFIFSFYRIWDRGPLTNMATIWISFPLYHLKDILEYFHHARRHSLLSLPNNSHVPLLLLFPTVYQCICTNIVYTSVSLINRIFTLKVAIFCLPSSVCWEILFNHLTPSKTKYPRVGSKWNNLMCNIISACEQ